MTDSNDKYARCRAAIADGRWSVDPERGLLFSAERGLIGHRNARGYIVASSPNPQVQVRVHRVIWEAVNGPIPADREINHKNGVKDDNRIANLELVTAAENIAHAIDTGLRSGGAACVHGHPYDAETTYIDKRGWRQCRVCWYARRHVA